MTTDTVTIEKFIADNAILMTAEPTPDNPHIDGMAEGAQHYFCTFTKLDQPAPIYTTYFSVGPGIVEQWMHSQSLSKWPAGVGRWPGKVGSTPTIKRPGVRYSVDEDEWGKRAIKHMAPKYRPDISDVLDCIASDASGYDNSQGFADWASDFGYDTDSIRAQATFNAVGENYLGLKALIGNAALQTLMYEVERL